MDRDCAVTHGYLLIMGSVKNAAKPRERKRPLYFPPPFGVSSIYEWICSLRASLSTTFSKIRISLPYPTMFIIEVVYALSPLICYVPQYFTLLTVQPSSTTSSSPPAGFSPTTCLLLLLANILRCEWYPFHHFKTTLLYQSVVMIFTQVLLLSAVVKGKGVDTDALLLPTTNEPRR